MHIGCICLLTRYAGMITITQNYLHEDKGGICYGRNDDAQQFYLGRH